MSNAASPATPRATRRERKNKPPSVDSQSLHNIMKAEAYRPIKANEGDKQITITVATAVLRSIVINSAKGQARSYKLFTDLPAKTAAPTGSNINSTPKPLRNSTYTGTKYFMSTAAKAFP